MLFVLYFAFKKKKKNRITNSVFLPSFSISLFLYFNINMTEIYNILANFVQFNYQRMYIMGIKYEGTVLK